MCFSNIRLFIWTVICDRYRWKIPEVSSQYFEISEVDMRHFFLALAWIWNGMCHLIKSFAEGTDWSTFLKVYSFGETLTL